MKHVAIPVEGHKTPAFYLAAEEYVARKFGTEPELWFTWRVEPCIVMGRNQVMENEINVSFCRDRKIGIYRRKSGGGCVYADLGNIMMSYIAEGAAVGYTFSKYIGLVVFVLRKLGIRAEASGRNDILVDGRKVSGSAFLHLPDRNIAHGTLLYDTCMDNMLGALTPTNAKLEAKGVKSVRSRIGLLKDYITLSIEELEQHLIGGLCRGEEIRLDADDVHEIERMAQDYLKPQFLYGNKKAANRTCHRRIEGVGDIWLDLVIAKGRVEDAWLSGDFFCVGKPAETLVAPLRGINYSEEGVREAFRDFSTESVIMNLGKEDWIDLVLDKERSL